MSRLTHRLGATFLVLATLVLSLAASNQAEAARYQLRGRTQQFFSRVGNASAPARTAQPASEQRTESDAAASAPAPKAKK